MAKSARKAKITITDMDGKEIDISADVKEFKHEMNNYVGSFFAVPAEYIKNMLKAAPTFKIEFGTKPTRPLCGPVLCDVYGVEFCAN